MSESVGRIIVGDACVAEGADWLALREPRFAAAAHRSSSSAPAVAIY